MMIDKIDPKLVATMDPKGF